MPADADADAAAGGRSPWNALPGVRRAVVGPLRRPLDAAVCLPGSKSYTNRALLLAAAARGPSALRGILRADDTYFCVEALRALGAAPQVDGDAVRLEGTGGAWAAGPGGAALALDVGAAGTTARFLPGLLCAGRGGPWRLDGSAQLRRRPLAPLRQALRALGGRIEAVGAGEGLPWEVHGGGLAGGSVRLAGDVSSQFFSGVLMAAPLAAAQVTVEVAGPVVQHAYVRMTLDTMAAFGAQVEADAALQTVRVAPGPYVGRAFAVEADASTAGAFLALAALSGGRIVVTNLTEATRQPDIGLVAVLRQMGCVVAAAPPGGLQLQGPPRLRGGFVANLFEMSDQTPTLAALAAFADAPVTLAGVGHVRHHESDRIAAMCHNLRALGVACDEHPDGLTVHPGTLRPAVVGSFDDHRIAMAMALVGAGGAGLTLDDPACVGKTCPEFFSVCAGLGVPIALS